MKRFLLGFICSVLLLGVGLPVYAEDVRPESESPREIKEIFNKKLLTQSEILKYGDIETLEGLKKEWKWAFSLIGGTTADKKYEAAFEIESIDYGGIDVEKPGNYTVTVVLKLLDIHTGEFTVSDEVRTLQIPVIVSEPDKIIFFYNKSYENFAQYDFSSPEGIEPVLWYAKVACGTEPGEENWEEAVVDEFYLSMSGAVRILSSALAAGSDYYLQMRGEGLVSDTLKLDTSLLIDEDEGINGDRDGNDNNDHTTEPPLTQPSPSTDGGNKGSSPEKPGGSENSGGSNDSDSTGDSDNSGSLNDSGSSSNSDGLSASGSSENSDSTRNLRKLNNREHNNKTKKETNVSSIKRSDESGKNGYEYVSNDTITVSGERLKLLLDSYTDKVPFGWNKVSVEIPVTFLRKLNLSTEDSLSLTLTRKDELSVTIALTAKGEKIVELDGVVVRVPVPEPDTAYMLTQNGKPLGTEVFYEQGCARFTIDRTGSYELCGKEEVLEVPGEMGYAPSGGLSKEQASVLPEPDFKDFLPAAIGSMGLLSCGVWFLWRKRRW